MQVEILTQPDAESYRKFLQTTGNSTVYHSLEWAQVIGDSYGFQPWYIVAKEKADIVGCLCLFKVNSFFRKQRLVGSPFSHYVEILSESDDVVTGMVDFLKAYFENNSDYKYIMLHNSQAYMKNSSFQKRLSYYSCKLELKGRVLSDIWESFDGNARKAVRKAEKSGIRIVTGNTLDDYKKFYHLLEVTRKEQGAPVYPYSFLLNLYGKLLPKGMCKLYLALYGNEVVAGILMLLYKRCAIYGYGGSVSDSELLKMRPNNLLFWEAIQDCYRGGYEVFDFGATPISHTGLLQFKRQWGTKVEEMPYSFMPRTGKISTIDRNSKKVALVGRLLKICPLSILRLVSPLMMREIP
jgi:CelD/BcsL family acetyltransferase involved in cellulose biosynthesis